MVFPKMKTWVVKQHVILGIDRREVEAQRDLWLLENPTIKVLRVHPLKSEPRSLLARLGSRSLPRVSIMVDYEDISTE